MGGGSTGLRSFSFPPATRARVGCWRMINSKSELGDNIVSGKPWGTLRIASKRGVWERRRTHKGEISNKTNQKGERAKGSRSGYPLRRLQGTTNERVGYSGEDKLKEKAEREILWFYNKAKKKKATGLSNLKPETCGSTKHE